MTSEIAIMNKTAIALAADSAVTIRKGKDEGQKTYDTVNKLFMLSKYHPVGIMIYGNSEMMGVPWELIIKMFRKKLSKRKFDTLKEYADNLIQFLERESIFSPESVQKEYFYASILGYLGVINKAINKEVKEIIEKEKLIKENQIKEIAINVITSCFETWKKWDALPYVDESYIKGIIDNYGELIKKAAKEVFEKLPISKTSFDQLIQICVNMFSKNRFPNDTSRIVIVGFGEKEIFPSLLLFEDEAVVNDKLKHRLIKNAEINLINKACIFPFAL